MRYDFFFMRKGKHVTTTFVIQKKKIYLYYNFKYNNIKIYFIINANDFFINLLINFKVFDFSKQKMHPFCTEVPHPF